MPTFLFNVDNFRVQFPPFKNIVTYPNEQLQAWWNMATVFISDQNGGCYALGMTIEQQSLALNLMTAHIALLNSKIAKGQPGGVLTGATIDKVTVQLMPPPASDQWQYWLNQTPYGTQLLGLLEMASAGGAFYGAFPIVPAFRR